MLGLELELECSGGRNKRDKYRDLLHLQPCSCLAQLVVVLRGSGWCRTSCCCSHTQQLLK